MVWVRERGFKSHIKNIFNFQVTNPNVHEPSFHNIELLAHQKLCWSKHLGIWEIFWCSNIFPHFTNSFLLVTGWWLIISAHTYNHLQVKPKFSFGKFYYFESSMPTDHTTPITGSKCLSFIYYELMKNVGGGGDPDIFLKFIKNIN